MFNKTAMNMNSQGTGSGVGSSTGNTGGNTGGSKTQQNTQSTKKTSDIPIPDNSVLGRLNRIKEQGNDLFRQGKYGEANDKYHEVINEITYVDDDNVEKYKKELDDLELLCRLNIANVKLKIEDYDLALRECLKVMKKNEKNFKANYRAGICYYKKCNFNKALECFIKAKEINSNEEAQQSKDLLTLVEKYIKECKRNCDTAEEAKVIIPQEEHKTVSTPKVEEEKKVSEPKKDSKRERLKEILERNPEPKDDIHIENNKRVNGI
jgi:tetratricopeptide (TPR) repeat protein